MSHPPGRRFHTRLPLHSRPRPDTRRGPPPPYTINHLNPEQTILNPNLWTYINPNLVTKPSILHDKAQTPNYNILIRNFEP